MKIPENTACMPKREFLRFLRTPGVRVSLVVEVLPGCLLCHDVDPEVIEGFLPQVEVSSDNESLEKHGVFARYEESDGEKLLFVGANNNS